MEAGACRRHEWREGQRARICDLCTQEIEAYDKLLRHALQIIPTAAVSSDACFVSCLDVIKVDLPNGKIVYFLEHRCLHDGANI